MDITYTFQSGVLGSPNEISHQDHTRTPFSPIESLDEYGFPDWTQVHQRSFSQNSSWRSRKKLRSQYPSGTTEPHVEFILVASFDIINGSIMEHQYPGIISGDEHMLADLMLPDQMHNRSQDWTMFFLHKDGNDEENPEEQVPPRRKRRRRAHEPDTLNGASSNDVGNGDSVGTESEDEEDEKDAEGPPLIYVLNLVNTKVDSTAERGAVVKAMAICTRHPFLHIYKPLLLLALEDYFKQPRIETLAALYNAANSMDLSTMPRLSLLERSILQASNAKDLFLERFQRMLEQQDSHAKHPSIEGHVKSPGGTPHTPNGRALPRDTHDFETRVIYNGVSVPVKVPTARSSETVGDFSIIKLIQTFSGPHMISPQSFSLHSHLTTGGIYTHPIIVLVNALLTQKRIMFLGHNMPSGEVAEAVLAACALASGGLLRGFTRHAFPYTDLSKIDDLQKVPGFIAGVTNPAFANKPEWWDILCDLPSGRIKISSYIDPPVQTEGLVAFQQQNLSVATITTNGSSGPLAQDLTGDVAFMDTIHRNITNRLGEGVIRSMWRDWIIKLTRIAAAFEEAVYGASALYIGAAEADAGAFGVEGHGYVWKDEATKLREMAGNVHRIEGWRNTRSYYSLIQDLARLYTSQPISSIDLHHHHDRLRRQKLPKEEAAAIYLAFEKAVRTPSEICQLLTVTPESHGGLFYISLGLLHPTTEVRYKTVELLKRIMRNEAGNHFWGSLGRFAKLAFVRIRKDMKTAHLPGDENEVELTRNMDRLDVSNKEAV